MPDIAPQPLQDRPWWTTLHAQVHRLLRQRHLLPKRQRLLVAVSGGQDSLCLIRLLLDLQPKWEWDLSIAHCNHCWRDDAAANADYVQQLARSWQVPYFCMTADEPVSSEATARDWRYRVLTELAIEQKCAAVVTGHTGSDRAETLLYNLMRGSGADGLQALTWQRELAPSLQLVRPLLEATRAETAQFCHQSHLKIWEDSTNQDWHHARNRIRQELLPYLRHFNPQVEQALMQTAELLQAEVAFLESTADRLWQQAIDPDVPHKIDRLLLRSAPLALQRRVMRRWITQTLQTSPNFDQIEKLTALIDAPNRSQTDPFPGGTIAQVKASWICLKHPI